MAEGARLEAAPAALHPSASRDSMIAASFRAPHRCRLRLRHAPPAPDLSPTHPVTSLCFGRAFNLTYWDWFGSRILLGVFLRPSFFSLSLRSTRTICINQRTSDLHSWWFQSRLGWDQKDSCRLPTRRLG